MKKLLTAVVIILIAGGGVIAYKKLHTQPTPDNSFDSTASDSIKSDYVLLNVPFTSQAPTGNWSDPRQEDGCEEASLLMAWSWVKNQPITPTQAEKAITDMSDFELAHYGNYNDLDAADTAKLMKDYYNYDKLAVKSDITIDDIKKELEKGNLVLVPANGQKLNNPHYTQPGPLTHFLVVRGFDDSKNLIITNDPGTKFGNNYSYSYDTFYNALVDYPSGKHADQTGRPKSMIVVSR